jgi:crotonobetainyl-CoA:carnitine CoA-transferase CaiB-like acyl-CoA transferase
MSAAPTTLPLSGVRVLDLGDPVGEAATRLLADLGADVIKVEPAGGAPSRRTGVMSGDVSLSFAVANANKRGGTLDLATKSGRDAFDEVARDSDIVVLAPLEATYVDAAELQARHPHLVVVLSSPFGTSGPRRDWQATERCLLALSGSLSRSGRPGGAPLLPPDGIVAATAATQLAWTALSAFRLAQTTGRGQVVDVAHHEAVVTGLDPAFGVQGSAAAGRSGKVKRDRPSADSYPVYPCADGFVRLCLLAKRQWRGMFAWLGEPAEFADPAYDSIGARFKAADRLDPLITQLFANQSGADLAEEAARRGVPLAQVLTLGEAVTAPHFGVAGTVAEVELTPGLTATTPSGCVDFDGQRLAIRATAPAVDSCAPSWPTPRTDVRRSGGAASLPFEGVRILDLGVIVFGAEIGRAFADLGADVVKVESLAFPDGLRQTRGGEEMNASFAWGQRGKRSLGLDLRSDEGRDLFIDLATESDVVLSNFKPGTLDSLGIGHAVLAGRNPGIVVVESAAFSSRGPWSSRLGYGPLVRAACGISDLWKYAADDAACWDGVTVFPDHVAAKVGALAVAAALHSRETSGRGARIELAQSDVVLHQLAAYAALESLDPGSVEAVGNRGRELFGGLFACAGDDDWCVIEARTTEELAVLRQAVGADGVDDLSPAVAAWTATRSPRDVMVTLQGVDVPVAAMLRLPELLEDEQLAHRATFTTMSHPQFDHTLPAESVASPYAALSAPDHSPAPAVGAHTREILTKVLALAEDEVDALIERGVVHEGVAQVPAGA